MITAVYFWKVPTRAIPFAIWSMALDRRRLRAMPGVSFAKMLGCGKGETFTPSDADAHRWGLLVTIEESQVDKLDSSPLVTRWRKRSRQEFRVLMDPIACHGKWSGKEPFVIGIKGFDGPSRVVAITRARIAWLKNLSFWKSVPPVVQALKENPGLIAAIGVGEAPIGLQGTFSLWESEEALKEFAFRSAGHKGAIVATTKQKWFSEELFARFRVKEIRGDL